MTDNNDILIGFVNLTKNFGNFVVVGNVNLEIHRGEILGFLGPNGAGKSTTMKMMAGLIEPTSGEIWIRGNGQLERLTNQNKDYLLDHIGFLVENPEFYPEVSPRQILGYFAKLRNYPRDKIDQRITETLAMVGLSDWIDKKIGTFSKGMRQKVGIIAAIIHDPEIVVLDEPHSGLDPQARREIRDFILKLKSLGKTIFLSSHLLFEVSELADRVAIISHGLLIACDTIDNLELQAKRSAIKLELLTPPNGNAPALVAKMETLVRPLIKISPNDSRASISPVKYNAEAKLFEIIFNGEPATQHQILKTLLQNGIDIIEFSVPKATLLEDIYLGLVKQSNMPPEVAH